MQLKSLIWQPARSFTAVTEVKNNKSQRNVLSLETESWIKSPTNDQTWGGQREHLGFETRSLDLDEIGGGEERGAGLT